MVALLASLSPARAQTAQPEPLYDPAQLPAFQGTLQLYTLTPVGDVDGFILTDGTEVKTPPHLTAAILAAIKPGDRVTVHGLKAASLPLIQAMSVTNDATGAAVVDVGPDRGQVAPPGRPRPPSETTSISIRGHVRMLIHGPRGDVNGALLDDGTILKLPPPEADRLAAVLRPGAAVEAEGLRRVTTAGTVVDVRALGHEGGPMQPIAGGSAPMARADGRPTTDFPAPRETSTP